MTRAPLHRFSLLVLAVMMPALLAFAPAALASTPTAPDEETAEAPESPRSRLPAPAAAPGHQPATPPASRLATRTEGSRPLPPVSAAPGAPAPIRYRELIEWAAAATGADPAIIAALMEVESSGERAVSPAGAKGLMQLMPDKFQPGDDPFDPATNLLRAAQHIRLLQDRWGAPEIVAAAYFGAIDGRGNVTGASDGNVNGHEYVARFRAAYQRYAA